MEPLVLAPLAPLSISSDSLSTLSCDTLARVESGSGLSLFAPRWMSVRLVNAGSRIATLRTDRASCGLDVEFDVELHALPFVSRQVEYGFIAAPRSGRLSPNTAFAFKLSIPPPFRRPLPSFVDKTPRQTALNKLRMRSHGGAGSASFEPVTPIDADLERARSDQWDRYVQAWRASLENPAVWEFAAPFPDEADLLARFLRAGEFYEPNDGALSEVARVARRVRQLTVDADPHAVRDTDASALEPFDRDAIEWLAQKKWIAFSEKNGGRVRLCGPAVFKLKVPDGVTLVDGDECVADELERQGHKVARRVHDWLEQGAEGRETHWVGMFGLARWTLPSGSAVFRPRLVRIANMTFSTKGVFATTETPIMTGSWTWLVTSSKPSFPFACSTPPPSWRVARALGSRVTGEGAADSAKTVPWRPCVAGQLRGSVIKFDAVVYVMSEETCVRDLWLAWEACRLGLVLVGPKPITEKWCERGFS